MSTNGEMRSYSEICDARVSLARRFARCGAKCFCVFARRRRAGARFRGRETYRTKKTDAGMDHSVVLSKTIDAIDPRRLSVLAPRGGLECRRGGFSNVPPRDRADRQKARSAKQSAKKVTRRRRPSPRASPLSCPPPLRRVFCGGLLRRSWSSRGGDGRTSRESVAFALRAGLRRASDGTVPSLAAGSRLIPARPQMSEKKRNVPRRDPPSSRPERVSFSASFSSPSLASRPNALLFERAPSASSSSRPFLSWWSGYLIRPLLSAKKSLRLKNPIRIRVAARRARFGMEKIPRRRQTFAPSRDASLRFLSSSTLISFSVAW